MDQQVRSDDEVIALRTAQYHHERSPAYREPTPMPPPQIGPALLLVTLGIAFLVGLIVGALVF